MASVDDVRLVRSLAQLDVSEYPDIIIVNKLDVAGATVNSVVISFWTEKASRYATLVDVTEGSSSRKLSQLYKQALAMADSFKANEPQPVDTTPRMFARSRGIERV